MKHGVKSLGFSEHDTIHSRTVIFQLKMKISQITAKDENMAHYS